MPTDAIEVQTQPVIYPESDGKPMAETDIHRQEMMDTIATLTEYFRERADVYVAGNLLLYYKEGYPRKSVAPDVFVVYGIERKLRRTYKLWEERVAPHVVFEISSASTRQDDLGHKRQLYARLGVAEYFLYDPLGEYLQPPLQGLRLHEGIYAPIPTEADGSLVSQVLGMRVTIEADRLRLVEASSGARLLRPAEVAEARRLAEQQAQTEQQARQLAEQRLMVAEVEIARLQAQLAHLQPSADAEDAM